LFIEELQGMCRALSSHKNLPFNFFFFFFFLVLRAFLLVFFFKKKKTLDEEVERDMILGGIFTILKTTVKIRIHIGFF
jgi:hypothetical protein